MREKCHDWAPMQEDPFVLPSVPIHPTPNGVRADCVAELPAPAVLCALSAAEVARNHHNDCRASFAFCSGRVFQPCI